MKYTLLTAGIVVLVAIIAIAVPSYAGENPIRETGLSAVFIATEAEVGQVTAYKAQVETQESLVYPVIATADMTQDLEETAFGSISEPHVAVSVDERATMVVHGLMGMDNRDEYLLTDAKDGTTTSSSSSSDQMTAMIQTVQNMPETQVVLILPNNVSEAETRIDGNAARFEAESATRHLL